MTHFVLVHGAWCGGWVWRQVAELLSAKRHQVSTVEQLPSGDAPGRLADLAADAAHVRDVVDGASGEVVLVGHSYGGMVITEIADHPMVAHSVYLTAFWPEPGQNLRDLRSRHPVEWTVDGGDGAVRITEDQVLAREVLAGDLDEERFAEFHRRAVAQSAASFTSQSTAPPRSHPTTYVVCELDQTIFVRDQQLMSLAADRVVRIDAGHLPMLSKPKEVAAALLQAR